MESGPVLEPEPPSFSVLSGDYGPNILQNGPGKAPPSKDKFSLDEEDFIASLDAKLKRLEEEERRGGGGGGKRKNGKKRSTSLDSRPMFITTVKTGIFLDPPPELAALLGYSRGSNTSGSTASGKSGEEIMYSFSSQPRVLNNGRPKPKVNNNEKQQAINAEKQRARRAKRDLSSSTNSINNNVNHNNNNNNNNHNKKEDVHYGNIMYDRRVVRGPAFLQQPVPTNEESPAARQAEARRRMMARRRAQSQRVRALRYRLGTPPQVEGRRTQSLQTHDYLEELYGDPPVSVETQTLPCMERPPTPPLEQVSVGVEAATQVFPGELFSFDLEVSPVLEVLVGKVLEQSLAEVLEEDEVAALRLQQKELREKREAHLAELQRLEAEEARRQRELESRIFEQEEAAVTQKETEERVAAAVLTTGYIVDLLPSVMQGLRDAGYLYDEVKDDVGGEFMDWLIKEVKTEMQRMVENKELLTDMLREILESRAELYRALGEKAAAKRGADDEEALTISERTPSLVEESSAAGETEGLVGEEDATSTRPSA